MVKPKVMIHNAVSLDGRMDNIVVDLELYYGLVPTFGEDATMWGSETMLSGMDSFIEAARQEHPTTEGRPLMVVVDSRGRIKDVWAMKRQQYWSDAVVLCSSTTPKDHIALLEAEGVNYIVAGDDKVDLRLALEELNRRFNVQSIRVDSGGTLNGALIREGLVDEVSVLVLPVLVGGRSPKSLFIADDLHGPDEAIDLEMMSMEKVKGDAVWLRYKVRH